MNRKAYKILTDIDLSRNRLLNVSNIESPAIDKLWKDLKIHANKGNLRIETTSDGNESESKGNIALGINKKTSISIKPDSTVNIDDNAVTVNGTKNLTLKSKDAKDDNSIILTSEDNSIKVDADIIKVGSKENRIDAINEYVNTNISTINTLILTNDSYTQTVSNNLALTTAKTADITMGKTDKYDPEKAAYLLSIKGVDKDENDDFTNYQSTEIVDNLNVRNSQTFSGSKFEVKASKEISLDAPTINIGKGDPENTSLHILSKGSKSNQFTLDVDETQSNASLNTLHVGKNLELKDELSFTNAENNPISFDNQATIKTPNLELNYPNSGFSVLKMKTTPSSEGEDPILTTTLITDYATISEHLTSTGTTLNGSTGIDGKLSVNAATSIRGESLGIDSTEINLGNLSNSELNINAKTIAEITPSKTLSTTESYKHTAIGTYEVTRAKDFEINASKEEKKNEAGEIVETTFDSHIRANTLIANNNVQIGEQSNGVNIYWDNLSKSLVFTKWE